MKSKTQLHIDYHQKPYNSVLLLSKICYQIYYILSIYFIKLHYISSYIYYINKLSKILSHFKEICQNNFNVFSQSKYHRRIQAICCLILLIFFLPLLTVIEEFLHFLFCSSYNEICWAKDITGTIFTDQLNLNTNNNTLHTALYHTQD